MESSPDSRLCHLYVNTPEHIFDAGLKAEAERTAAEVTRNGFPLQVVLRYGKGDEQAQMQQIDKDRHAQRPPDLFVVIPINREGVYRILSEVVSTREDATCVFLHQPLTRMHRADLESHKGRLFSVGADQKEIGRLQGRQFAAVLPKGSGDVLYVQGQQKSYATAQRMLGLLEELSHAEDIRVSGHQVYGDWSSESVRPAFDDWVAHGGRPEWIEAAGAQNDDMALALAALLKEKGLWVPVIGVDGLKPGTQAVQNGTLAATIVQPLGVGHALRLFRAVATRAKGEAAIPDDGNVMLPPESYPALTELRRPNRT